MRCLFQLTTGRNRRIAAYSGLRNGQVSQRTIQDPERHNGQGHRCESDWVLMLTALNLHGIF